MVCARTNERRASSDEVIPCLFWRTVSAVYPAVEMPWGGFKASGYGRDLSAYALDDYSRTKHIMVKHHA